MLAREARLRRRGPAESGQGRSRRCTAAPRAARCTCSKGAAAVRRASRGSDACVDGPRCDRSIERGSARARARRGRAAATSAAAAPRISTAKRRKASRFDVTRLSPASSSYEPTRARRHRALRHAAGRARSGARRAAASACRSSRRTSAPAPPSAAWSPPGSPGPARAAAGGVRDYVLGATLLNGRGEVLSLRRPGDEERRRLRRVAPARRLARHARRDLRGVAEGAAACRRRTRDAALRDGAGAARCEQLNRWAGAAAAAQRQRLARRHAASCACAARWPAVSAAVATLGGELIDAKHAARFWDGLREQSDEFFDAARRRRAGDGASVAPLGAADRAAARCSGEQLIEWGGARAGCAPRRRRRRCETRPTRPAAMPRCSVRRDKSRRRVRAAVAAAATASIATEEAPSIRGHLQSRPPVPGPLSATTRCKRISRPSSRDTPEGQEAEAILRKCVHCGFCTATCPTYQLLGDELDGPRGRIYLMKQVLEGAAAHAQHAAAPGPLPDLPQLRDHLSVGRAVRAAWSRSAASIVEAARAAAGRRASAHALAAEGGPDVAGCSSRR